MTTFDDIVFETRSDAEKVVDDITEIYRVYGQVYEADVYDLADVPSPYMANSYGWSGKAPICEVVRVRDGYTLKMPESKRLTDNQNLDRRVSYRYGLNLKKSISQPVEIIICLDQINKTSLAMELAEEIAKAITNRPVTIRIV